MRAPTTKRNWLRVLLVLGVMLSICPITLAAEDVDAEDQSEVLTSLELRMQKRISVDFRDMPIDDVIRIIAEQADVDIIKSPTVLGNVTATLTDVPLDEALNNILAAHGYGYISDRNMIRVAPVAELNIQAEAMVSKIYRVTYADVVQVEQALQKFKSPSGMVSSNPGTSHLIVTDTESQIKAIDTFITEIDQITSQIMVEVRIYDITENELLDLGVEWRAGRDTTWTPPLGPGGFRPFVSTPSGTTDPHIDGTFQSSSRETSDVLGAFRLGWLNDSLNVDAILHAQLENTKAKLLANPRILVLDNEIATFNIVREIPYKESTVSAGGSTETIKFKNVGVNLEVMPHVTRDGLLRLNIAPDFGVVVGQDDSTGVVIVDTRKLKTTALVNDGDTVVLAGLHKKDVSERVNKIPLLGDLPIIGVLFKFEAEDTANNELVVFITPHIIEQPAPLTDWEQKAWQHTDWVPPEPANTYKEDPDKKWFDWGNEDEE